ncbi:O-acyltransferase WSD1-like [Eucalyptus grandis]|uniref:O-acyltransferase WSD1-like n=1 Tax=Eucalyptus grandis TaxID=71139 RepID=UPI00192EB7BF|nr:O-acyltransferase WSD1-like [Eucalyptus grandis]
MATVEFGLARSHGFEKRDDWSGAGGIIDQHVVVVHGPVANLSIDSPGFLGDDKPLWDVRLLMAHRCVVFRIHHALGDGISMFLALCRRVDNPEALPTIGHPLSAKRRRGSSGEWWKAVERVLGVARFKLVFVVEFVLRSMWASDWKTPVSGGAGVELWPRKLAAARFRVEDMKVCGFGINQELSNFIKGNPGLRWGNKFGILLLPVHYCRSSGDPLEYLRKAKSMIGRKKKSLEVHFSYRIGDIVMTYLGARIASLLNYKIICNTSFTSMNVLGPREEIAVMGNPITYVRVNSSSLPHALTMQMVSYAGRVDMQILVVKDIIPDPDFLAKCFEDALREHVGYAI